MRVIFFVKYFSFSIDMIIYYNVHGTNVENKYGFPYNYCSYFQAFSRMKDIITSTHVLLMPDKENHKVSHKVPLVSVTF